MVSVGLGFYFLFWLLFSTVGFSASVENAYISKNDLAISLTKRQCYVPIPKAKCKVLRGHCAPHPRIYSSQVPCAFKKQYCYVPV